MYDLSCVPVLIIVANINDRSLLGKKDSEVSVIIEDTDMVCLICIVFFQDVALNSFVNACMSKDKHKMMDPCQKLLQVQIP